eukprot:978758-Amorphochlora_amoeboformis.AAC.1
MSHQCPGSNVIAGNVTFLDSVGSAAAVDPVGSELLNVADGVNLDECVLAGLRRIWTRGEIRGMAKGRAKGGERVSVIR